MQLFETEFGCKLVNRRDELILTLSRQVQIVHGAFGDGRPFVNWPSFEFLLIEGYRERYGHDDAASS